MLKIKHVYHVNTTYIKTSHTVMLIKAERSSGIDIAILASSHMKKKSRSMAFVFFFFLFPMTTSNKFMRKQPNCRMNFYIKIIDSRVYGGPEEILTHLYNYKATVTRLIVLSS